MNTIEALFRATTSLSSDLDLDAILPKALGILREVLRCDNAAVLLPERPGSKILKIRAAVGYRPEVVRRLRLKPGEGISGWVMKEGKIANVPDVTKDPRYVAGVSGARSEIALPLVSEGRRVGVLDIEARTRDAFRHKNVLPLLQVFAAHLATAVANAERLEQIRLQNRNLDLAARIGQIATSTLNLAEMLDRSLKVIRPKLGCSHLDCLLLDDAAEALVVRAICSTRGTTSMKKGDGIPIDRGLVGAAFRARKPVLVADVRRDRRYLRTSPTTRSELVVPIAFGDEILGVINAESEQLRGFGRDDVRLLASVGSTLAAAIRNSRLYGELIEYSDRVSQAQAFARTINSTLGLADILAFAAEQLGALAGARRGAIFLHHAERGTLELVAHNFPGIELGGELPIDSDSIAARAARDGEMLNEVARGRAGAQHPAFPNGPLLALPLRLGNQTIGVSLLSERSDGQPFSDYDAHFAGTAVDHLTVAIANAQLYQRTLHLSVTDGLTGLYVHRAFYERLDQEIQRARDSGKKFGLIMGDLDHFKSINDRFGHPVGDRLLARVAGVILASIRPQDIAARYGGEEFCILLPDADTTGALHVAERIRRRLETELFVAGDERISASISFGVADFDPESSDRTALMEEVDQALYRAKRAGRNRCEVA